LPVGELGNRVVLRQGRARPLWFGHPWVYSNAVLRVEGTLEAGAIVPVYDHDDHFIARGMWNPNSQIPIRVLDREQSKAPLDAAYFETRVKAAMALRASIGLPSAQTTAYRLVNSEGDGLPGLVVDVFGKGVAVQITTLGLWQCRDAIFDALSALLKPETIFQVGAGTYGDVEGFASQGEPVRGKGGNSFVCREDGIELVVEPLSGQKTGMFLDQRMARMRVGQLAKGKRVLDLYAYAGGFSLQAARGGATKVTAVDSSARAVARIAQHATENRLSDKITAVESDVFRYLEAATPGSVDLVIVDPPKFASARKDLEAARKGYERLNALALKTCAPGGLMLTCSCSQNVSEDDLERIVAAAGKQAGRTVTLLERSGAGPDHPVPPGFAEGRYLKVLLVHVA
jgi:23S rRNA (cytosine1962-C5)-methyltransferase